MPLRVSFERNGKRFADWEANSSSSGLIALKLVLVRFDECSTHGVETDVVLPSGEAYERSTVFVHWHLVADNLVRFRAIALIIWRSWLSMALASAGTFAR